MCENELKRIVDLAFKPPLTIHSASITIAKDVDGYQLYTSDDAPVLAITGIYPNNPPFLQTGVLRPGSPEAEQNIFARRLHGLTYNELLECHKKGQRIDVDITVVDSTCRPIYDVKKNIYPTDPGSEGSKA